MSAAVAIVLSPDEVGRRDILFVRRATYEGDPWSGHIALPGGRVESGDLSLEDTARRETFEETGIDLVPGSCIARLASVAPRSMPERVTVHPFVFAYDGPRNVVLSDEIAEAWWIPLAELRDPAAWSMTEVQTRSGTLRVRGYPHRDATIWGLTERILAEFIANENSILHGGYRASGIARGAGGAP